MKEAEVSATILVVDDDPDVLHLVSDRLKSWGYQVLEASAGDEALQVAEEKQPDLILLDTILPNMDGREVCENLRQNESTREIAVIFLTALELADHIKAGMDVGADDYIIKPIDPNDLQRRIRVCLARRQDGSHS